jgi:hypothetical protein
VVYCINSLHARAFSCVRLLTVVVNGRWCCAQPVFAGSVLELMNSSIWDEWQLPDHLDALYTPFLGSAIVRVQDASTKTPVANATMVVTYGNYTHVTRKRTDHSGTVSFGGWAGRVQPAVHRATVSAPGYEVLMDAVVGVKARTTTPTLLQLTRKSSP